MRSFFSLAGYFGLGDNPVSMGLGSGGGGQFVFDPILLLQCELEAPTVDSRLEAPTIRSWLEAPEMATRLEGTYTVRSRLEAPFVATSLRLRRNLL